jgi:hypothetical protein
LSTAGGRFRSTSLSHRDTRSDAPAGRHRGRLAEGARRHPFRGCIFDEDPEAEAWRRAEEADVEMHHCELCTVAESKIVRCIRRIGRWYKVFIDLLECMPNERGKMKNDGCGNRILSGITQSGRTQPGTSNPSAQSLGQPGVANKIRESLLNGAWRSIDTYSPRTRSRMGISRSTATIKNHRTRSDSGARCSSTISSGCATSLRVSVRERRAERAVPIAIAALPDA